MIPYRMNPMGISAPAMPTDGLVFYAPLNRSAATAKTGQPLTNVNATFTTLDGIACARVGATSPNSYIATPAATLPKEREARSISAWVNTDMGGTAMFYGYGKSSSGNAWMQGIECFSQYGDAIFMTTPQATGKWHSVVTTFDGGSTVKCFIDGILNGQGYLYINTTVTDVNLYFGGSEMLRQINGIHHIAAFRVYDRVLTQDEILILASEF